MHGEDAARLSHLNQVIAECDAWAASLSAEQKRLAHHRSQAVAERDALLAAAQIRDARAAELVGVAARPQTVSVAPAAAVQPAPPPSPPQPAQPAVSLGEPQPAVARLETSVVSVQNVLLVLGGVLLGVAAITFSVVAWTAYGHSGQSLILAGGTAVALAVPVLLARRGLAATAETISGVALLLVALDGFTIWSLALFDIDRIINGYAYAGLVFALTCAVAVGYRRLTGLTVAWYVALLAAQPVLPLVAIGAVGGRSDGPDTPFSLADLPTHAVPLCGAAVLAAAVAAQNLAVAVRRTNGGAFAWVLHGVALAVSWLVAVTALVVAPAPESGALATATVLLCAGLGVGAAWASGRSRLLDATTAMTTVAAVGAAFRMAVLIWPASGPVALAGAVLAAAVASRWLPAGWRRGPHAASAVITALLAAGVATVGLGAGVNALASDAPTTTWRLPVTVVLATVAAGVLLPRGSRHHAVLAGFGLAVLVAPAAFALPSWAPPWPAVVAGLGLGLSSLRGGVRNAAVRVGGGAALYGYAVGAALPTAGLTAAVLAAELAGCLSLAGLAARRPTRKPIADAACGGALAILPALTWSCLAVAGMSTTPRYVVVSATAALCLAAAAAARRRPGVVLGAAVGVLLAGVAGAVAGPPTAADVGVSAVLVMSAVLLALAADGSRPVARLVGYATTTAALVAAVARLSAVAVPGTGVLTAAALASTIGIWAARRTAGWGRGPAAGALACGGGVLLIGGGIAIGEALAAVVAASAPAPWSADLTRWPELAAAVAALGHQLPFALAVLCVGCAALPERYRDRAALVAGAVSVLSAPAAFGLPWWMPAAMSGTAAVVVGVIAVRAPSAATSRGGAIVAGLLGLHASAAASGRPASMAVVLGGAVLVCASVGVLGHVAPYGPHHRRLAGPAVGGALAAFPGGAASLAAAAGLPTPTVVAIALATASVALTVGSLVRLARGAEAPAVGAAAGAMLTGVVILSTGMVSPAEFAAVGVLLIAAALRVFPRRRRARDVAGAGGATLALIVSLSRLAAVLVPGVVLLTTSAVILLVALGVGRLPRAWRRAPASAVALAVVAVGAVCAMLAILHGQQVAAAGLPLWRADLASVDGMGLQPVPALVLLAAAALALATSPLARGWGTERARDAAAVALGLAVIEAPVALSSPWWIPAAVGGSVAVGCALASAVTAPRMAARLAVAGAVLGGYAAVAALSRPVLTVVVLGALVVGGTLVAAAVSTVDGYRRIGGGATAAALIALPGAAAAAVAVLGLSSGAVLRCALTACAVALGVAGWLRRVRPAYVPYAIAAVAADATATVLATIPNAEPTRLYAALATLIGVGAGLLLRADRRRRGQIIAAAAGVPLAIATVCVVPAVVAVLFAPYGWIANGWEDPPAGSTEGLAPGGFSWPGTGWDPLVLALLALAAAMAAAGLGLRARLTPVVASCAALAVVATPAAWHLPWPSGPAAASCVAIVAGLYAARWRPSYRLTIPTATVLCGLCGAAGFAGALATEASTYAALGLAASVGVAVALTGRRTPARVTGWLVAGGGALGLVGTAAFGVPVPPALAASSSAVLAALFLGAAAVRPNGQRAETATVEVLSFVAAAVAVLIPAGLRVTAAILVGYGAVLGLSALRPRRSWLAMLAAGCEVIAWWLLLFSADVSTVEAYTLPVTLFAVLAGALQLRRRPYLSSWLAYGPALAATFLPSLALLLAGQAHPMRRLLIGAGAVVVLVLGARHSRQAPVACGAVVVLVMAAYELIRYWDTLPRWAPMGAGGLVLVVLGATYERRLRDMRRLRSAMAQMQ